MPPRKSTSARPEPVSTREHLLQTAISLFSAKGFDGVSVNDIVDRASVNKRMVYHYFKSKARLYQETLSFAYAGLGEFERNAIAGETTLEGVVKRLIWVYFEFPRIHPEFTQLMLWENLNKGQGIRNSKARLTKEVVVDHLTAAIAGEADGFAWRKDLDPRLLLITIIGICQVYASHRYTLSQGLHLDLGSEAEIKRGMGNAEHYILTGMRPVAAARKSKP